MWITGFGTPEIGATDVSAVAALARRLLHQLVAEKACRNRAAEAPF